MKNISLDSAYLLFTLKKLNLYVHTGQLLAHHPDPHFDRRSDDGDAAVVLQGSKEIWFLKRNTSILFFWGGGKASLGLLNRLLQPDEAAAGMRAVPNRGIGEAGGGYLLIPGNRMSAPRM